MRTWLITGASRGFGTLIVQQALAAGDSVIATARKPEDIEARLGQHPNLLAVRLDVTGEGEAYAAVAAGIERFGQIDVLVNNAGPSMKPKVNVMKKASFQPMPCPVARALEHIGDG